LPAPLNVGRPEDADSPAPRRAKMRSQPRRYCVKESRSPAGIMGGLAVDAILTKVLINSLVVNRPFDIYKQSSRSCWHGFEVVLTPKPCHRFLPSVSAGVGVGPLSSLNPRTLNQAWWSRAHFCTDKQVAEYNNCPRWLAIESVLMLYIPTSEASSRSM
jgi:hypothetical protein